MMAFMRKLLHAILLVDGAIAVQMGLLWTGQGLGLIMWPSSSFMLGERQWAVNGSITVVVGLGLIWLADRVGRRS